MKAFVFYIVGLCFFSVKLYAYEFQNFKVDQKHLQQRQKQVASAATGTLSRSNSSSILKLQSFTPTLESDSDMESPLMQEIHSYLEQEFVSLSEEQRQVLWERGRRFDLGVKNFSGLTWQKPMGSIFCTWTVRFCPALLMICGWPQIDWWWPLKPPLTLKVCNSREWWRSLEPSWRPLRGLSFAESMSITTM